ncbi:hypothetical protein LOTGIDRAFT_154409 [Lottia gigantea]|uniref:Uncharacterized protein n=1 Tax=Lottia gigantea TaxID=225164 RepID=V4BL37_LOTGI|nr:hypothetical protein LOTGIDRAFT_154409 [Lottia gigantea]ESO89309.1 hypothetical protein LOTGIDRAFT_154409 [Lottia gigantea]
MSSPNSSSSKEKHKNRGSGKRSANSTKKSANRRTPTSPCSPPLQKRGTSAKGSSSKSPDHLRKTALLSPESSLSSPKASRYNLVESSSSGSGRENVYSPNTEYRLTQQRIQEYNKRQDGLAEKSRQRVRDAIAIATKYLSKPLKLPDISVRDFLKACELEARARRLKTCHRASYFVKSPELCGIDIECVQCEVDKLREGLNRIYSRQRFRCEHHRFSPTMDGGGEHQPRPVSICKKVELQSRRSSAKASPPVPAPSPFSVSQNSRITPETRTRISTANSGKEFTPDSEYDNGKVNDLINRYIPRPKQVHYQCRPRSRMFLYTDKAKSCNIVHHPYAVYRGNKILTANGKQWKDSNIGQALFSVPNLGIAYILPDINPNLGPRHMAVQEKPSIPKHPNSASVTSALQSRQWNREKVLPPIKSQKTSEEGE